MIKFTLILSLGFAVVGYALGLASHLQAGPGVERLTSLTAPQGVAVDPAKLDSGIVSLTWTAVPDALSYDVFRGTNAELATADRIATNVPAPQFSDFNPPPGLQLNYWIRATDAVESGPASEPVTARQDTFLWSWTSTGSLTTPVVLTNGWVVVGVNRRGTLVNPPNLGRVYAFGPGGSLEWEFDTKAGGFASPSVTPDNRVLFGLSRGTSTALWSVSSLGSDPRETVGGATGGVLAVSHAGMVYLLGRSVALSLQIQAYDANGTLVWSKGIATGNQAPQFSIRPDGLLAAGTSTSISVFDHSGTQRWVIGAPNQSWSEPVWTPNHLLAVNSRQELIAIQPDGVPIWTNRVMNGSASIAGPAVDSQGKSYLTDAAARLHAIDSSGQSLWQLQLIGLSSFTPALDTQGQILVATAGGISVVRTNGTLSHTLLLPEAVSQAPVLSEDGILYLVAYGQLRAYRHTAGLDQSAIWPMARRDFRGTSAVAIPSHTVQLGIRNSGTKTILTITAPPPSVRLESSPDGAAWSLVNEFSTTGDGLDWEVPPGTSSPTLYRATLP